MEKLLTTKEVADLLQCHPQSVYRNEELSCVKIPGIGKRYKESELEKYLDQKTIKISSLLSLQIIKNKSFSLTFPPENAKIISKKSGGISELAKAKSKTRYNFGFGAIYQRKTKKGKIRWYLDYRDRNGKRIQKVVTHAASVEDATIELKNIVLNEHYRRCGIENKRKEIGFSAFAQIYLQDYIMIARRNFQSDNYRLKKLREFFKDVELREISPLMIEKFRKSRLNAGNTKSTCNRYMALLKRMFNLAIDEGYLENNPVKKIKFYPENPARERVLTVKEERRLMKASSEHLKSVLIVALNSGMRASEILSLQWNQVDFGAKKIRVEKTKSGKTRFININTPLLEELLKLRERNGQSPFVFPNSETGRPLNSVKKAFKGACRRAGIKGLRLHDLRHTFASRLIERGVDIETLRSLLGHYSILITQRYTHSDDERKQKAVELLSKKPKEKAKNGGNLLHIRYTEKEKSAEKSLKNSVTPFYSVN